MGPVNGAWDPKKNNKTQSKIILSGIQTYT